MALEDIKEVRECRTQEEVNILLNQGNWRVIDAKVEKLRIPIGKEKVGKDMCSGFWAWGEANRFEVKYEERLTALYILGKYE